MRYFSIIIITMLLAGLMACSFEGKVGHNKQSTVSIPALLERAPAIRYGIEWDKTQNYYVQKKNEIQKDPTNLKARIELAELFMQEARVTGEHGHYYPAALQLLDEVLEKSSAKDDKRFRALANKASVELSLHDFKKALATAELAVAINPYNAKIYGVLVDANVELGNYDAAVKMADKMVSIRPDLRSYSRVSYLREIHGQVEGAIKALQMAVDAGYPGQESTAWARLTLGDLYFTYGMLEEAAIQYQLILQEREDYPFAIAALGKVAQAKGEYAVAEAYYKNAAAIIPEVGFYASLAGLYKEKGNAAASREVIDEIFPMLKDDTDNCHNMDMEYAHIYLDLLEKPEKALEYAQKEYEKRPGNIDVNRLLAEIYNTLGDQDLAKKHLETARKTNSMHPELKALMASL